MKHTMIYALLVFAIGCTTQATKTGEVESAIINFAKAADTQNAGILEDLLDDKFRIAMNQMFGGSDVQIIDKAFYISKITSKEWGGDRRNVTIENVTVVGKNATAKVTLIGEKSTFISLLTLSMDADGEWKILQDVPMIS